MTTLRYRYTRTGTPVIPPGQYIDQTQFQMCQHQQQSGQYIEQPQFQMYQPQQQSGQYVEQQQFQMLQPQQHSGQYTQQPQLQMYQPQQQYFVDHTGAIIGVNNVSETSAMVYDPATVAYNDGNIHRYAHQNTPNWS